MRLRPRDRRPVGWVGHALVAVMLVGLLAAAIGAWRPGLLVVGGALMAAAAVRTTAPPERLGTLALRTRWIDVTWMSTTGAVLLFAAVALP